MDLKTYLAKTGTSQNEFAKRLGVTQSLIWQWLNEVRPIPVERMPDIELASGGMVTRMDMHPEWSRIWPELKIMRERA